MPRRSGLRDYTLRGISGRRDGPQSTIVGGVGDLHLAPSLAWGMSLNSSECGGITSS